MWLPPSVSREHLDSTAKHEAALSLMTHVKGQLEDWTAELKRIDPYLELIRAAPNATAAGLRPGFYHVMRHNPGAPPSLLVIEYPDGSYREPDSGILDMLRHADMWDDRVIRDREKRNREIEKSLAACEEREDRERQEEMMERLDALTKVRVSMNRDSPWSQNVAGQKAVR